MSLKQIISNSTKSPSSGEEQLQSQPRQFHLTAFALLFLAALAIRGAALFVSLDSFNDDPDDYRRLAENWYSYGIFGKGDVPTAFRPPLYPWTLKELVLLRATSERPSVSSVISKPNFEELDAAPAKSIFNLGLSRNASIALWHWVLGIATTLLAYALARRFGLSERAAALAGFLTAIDPILIQQSRLVMTETLAAFFAAALLLASITAVDAKSSKRRAVSFLGVGILYGAAILCRPAFFAFAGLAFLNLVAIELYYRFVFKENVDASICASCARLIAFLVGLTCVIAPWGLRNYREFNQPILTTTHGGYTLYLANNPQIYEHYRSDAPTSLWNPEEFHAQRVVDYKEALEQQGIIEGSKESELFQDRWTKNRALATIRGDMKTFLRACRIRFCELWRVLPNNVDSFNSKTNSDLRVESPAKRIARLGVAAFYSLEFLAAIFGSISFVLSGRKQIKDEAKPTLLTSVLRVSTTPIFWGALLILSVQIPHLFYWTNMRMRAPLQIFIPILCAKLLKSQKRNFQNNR